MRREVKVINKKIDAIRTALYFESHLSAVEKVTLFQQNIKPLQNYLARSRGYKDWTEFRAIAAARQQNSMAFDRNYDED